MSFNKFFHPVETHVFKARGVSRDYMKRGWKNVVQFWFTRRES